MEMLVDGANREAEDLPEDLLPRPTLEKIYAAELPKYDPAQYDNLYKAHVWLEKYFLTDSAEDRRAITKILLESKIPPATLGRMCRIRLAWPGRYAAPALRFQSIVVDPPQLTGADWPTIFGISISDRVIVTRRPPGGRLWRQDCLVEGINHDISPATWRVSFNLSPADMTQYWVLGTHALNTTAKVGY